jgi:hypothetical protein
MIEFLPAGNSNGAETAPFRSFRQKTLNGGAGRQPRLPSVISARRSIIGSTITLVPTLTRE